MCTHVVESLLSVECRSWLLYKLVPLRFRLVLDQFSITFYEKLLKIAIFRQAVLSPLCAILGVTSSPTDTQNIWDTLYRIMVKGGKGCWFMNEWNELPKLKNEL
eukprot:sb/3478040/